MSEHVEGSRAAVASPELLTEERQELERLRAQVAALQAARAPAAGARRPVRWASVGSAVLLVLGLVLVPLSVLAIWTHNQVSETERFVATVSPVVEDPSVQTALADRITAEVLARVDVQQIVDDTVNALAAQGLPPRVVDRLRDLTGPLAEGARRFVGDKVREAVASPTFVQAAQRSTEVVHEQLQAVLSGRSSAITIEGRSAVLDLAPFIEAAKQRLVASGFAAAARIPEIHPTVELFPASYLVQAQTAYRALDAAATWLPWFTLLILVGGVLMARRRSRAVIAIGLGVMGVMVLLAVALLVARGLLVDSVAEQAAAPAAAIFDTVVRFLRTALRTLFLIGLIVALGAFLVGPAHTAVRVRGALSHVVDRLRGGGVRRRLQDGPVGPWVHAYRTALRTGLVLLAALVVVFLDRPSGGEILAIAVTLVVLLGVIEFLNQPRSPEERPLTSAADRGPIATGEV